MVEPKRRAAARLRAPTEHGKRKGHPRHPPRHPGAGGGESDAKRRRPRATYETMTLEEFLEPFEDPEIALRRG